MEMTPERFKCLRVIEGVGGRMSHEDDALKPFCDDASTLTTPDIFNQCHDAGWLASGHDDRTDSSTVRITPEGQKAMDAARGRQWVTDQARQLNAECEVEIERLHGKPR